MDDALLDERLLGVEVFIKGGADHAVVVNRDSVLLKHVVQVCPGLGLATIVDQKQQVPSLLEISLQGIEFVLGEGLGRCTKEEHADVLDPLESDLLLVDGALRRG